MENTTQQDRTRKQQVETLSRWLAGGVEHRWQMFADDAAALLDGPVARMIADAEQAAERRGAERVTAAVDAVIREDLEAGLDYHAETSDRCSACLAEAVADVLHSEGRAL